MSLKFYSCYLVQTAFLFCGAVLFFPLNATELRFPNGEVFQTDFLYEDDRNLFVKFRGKDYKVPKRSLESYDLSKKGSSVSSFRLYSFILKDGSVIRGTIAEEKTNEYTIKTEIGFLILLKSELKPPYPIQSPPPDFPEEYRTADKETSQTKLGFSLNYLPTFAPLSQTTPSLTGFNFFVEPAFLKLSDKLQTGFKFEYQTGRFTTIQTGYGYLFYSKQFGDNPLLDFYSSFGIGISQIAFRQERSNLSYAGTSPTVNIELGWQGLKYSKSFYRFGWKNQCFFEERRTLCGSGLEISAGWAF